MTDNPLSSKVGLDTTDFKSGIAQMNRDLRLIESGFRASAASLGDWGKTASGLELRMKALTEKIQIQQQKASALQKEYERVAAEKGETSRAAQELQIKLNRETETLNKMSVELEKTEGALKDMANESNKTGDKTEDLRKKQKKAEDGTNDFRGALRKLGTTMGGIVGGLGSVARGLGNVARSAGQAVAKLTSLAAQTAKTVATVGLAVGLAVGGMIFSTIDPAKDLNETLSKTRVVFGEMATSVIANAKKADEALGVNQQEYLNYASSIAAALTAGGMGVEEATKISENAVKNFADLASFHNAEVGDVSGAWQSAIRGSYEPIQRYFPFITDSYLKTYGTANGLIDANSKQLTANQRALILDAIAFNEELNPALDDFSETSKEMANQQRIFSKQLDNTKTTIGMGLLPVITEMYRGLNNIFGSDGFKTGVEELSQKMADFGGTALKLFSGGFETGGLAVGLQSLFKGLVGMSPVLSALSGPFAKVSGYFTDFMGIISGGGDIASKGAGIGGLIANIIGDMTADKANLATGAIGIIQGLVEGLTGAIPELLPVALNLLQSLVQFILTALPQLIPLAVQIIQSLADFLVQNFPMLITVGINAILMLINGILPQLPMLVGVALEAVVTLANGISQALPELIPTIIAIVLQIVNVILENLPMLIDAALNLILALADGIIAALPILLEQAPQIVTAIFDAIVASLPLISEAAVELINTLLYGILDMLPQIGESAGELVGALGLGIDNARTALLDAGKNMVLGLWEGIQNQTVWFGDRVSGFVKGIIDGIKKALGIASPSAVMADEIGKWLPPGIVIGFKKTMGEAERELSGLFAGLTQNVVMGNQFAVNSGSLVPGFSGGLSGQPIAAGCWQGDVIIQANVSSDMDVTLLARRVAKEIEKRRN